MPLLELVAIRLYNILHVTQCMLLVTQLFFQSQVLLCMHARQDTVDASVQHISTAVGDRGLQGLVNNAGKAVLAPAEFMPLQTFKDVMEVNVVGVLRTSQAFLPLLRGPQKGRIVNISSVVSTYACVFVISETTMIVDMW